MAPQLNPAPGDPDHGWVDFERMAVEVDGAVLPIIGMLTQAGKPTRDSADCAVVLAGQGDTWISLRLLPPETVH